MLGSMRPHPSIGQIAHVPVSNPSRLCPEMLLQLIFTNEMIEYTLGCR